jgi:hypothetical protein
MIAREIHIYLCGKPLTRCLLQALNGWLLGGGAPECTCRAAGGRDFAAIFKESCHFEQHSSMACVYP